LTPLQKVKSLWFVSQWQQHASLIAK
jgi:hypothetical protein